MRFKLVYFLLLLGSIRLYAQQPAQNQLPQTAAAQQAFQLVDSTQNILQADSTQSAQHRDSLQQSTIQALQTKGEAVAQDSIRSLQNKLPQELQALKGIKSLPTIDSTTADSLSVQLGGKAQQVLKDSLNQRTQSAFGQFMPKNTINIPRDSTGKVDYDSLFSQGQEKGVQLLEQQLKGTKEAKAFEEMGINQFEEQQTQFEELQALQEDPSVDAKLKMKQKMATVGKQFIQKHGKQVGQVQKQMSGLKEQYSMVSDKAVLDEAIKRTSLKGEPLYKRITLGGNFSLATTKPFTLDISPVIAFKVNKKAEIGVTFTFRQSFEEAGQQGIQAEETVYGYGIMGNYNFYRNFFLYIEGGRFGKSTFLLREKDIKWEENLAIGLGYRAKITPWLSLQTLATYNVLRNYKDDITNSPFTFKTGFIFNKQ